MTNIDLSTQPNLHVLNAANSGLTSFTPTDGVNLTSVTLPSTIQSIVLNKATVSSLTYIPTATLREVSLRNVSGAWDIKTFIFDWIDLLNAEQKSLASITLTGINWTGMSASQVLKLSTIGSKTLYGKVTLSSINAEEYQQLIEAFGTSVFDANGQFVIDAPSSMFLTGPSEIIEGGSDKYTATAFPVTEQQILYKLYNNGTLISTSTDANGKIYRKYGGVTLYEESGNITVDTGISSDVTLQVRAWTEDGNVFSDFVSIKAKRITYPSAIAINGTGTVYDNGQYSYTKVFSTNDFTAQITNVNWTLSQTSVATIYDSDDNGATINITGVSSTSTTIQLICTITFTGNVTRTATKNITLQYLYPSSITISGDASITSVGNYTYTKTFNTNNFTAPVLDTTWSISNQSAGSITSSGNDTATFTASPTDDFNSSITITCIVTFSGGITVSGTKSVSVNIKVPAGIFAAYEDGSLREYDQADTNAIGVAVVKQSGGFIIDKTHNSQKTWGGYGTTIADITTTTTTSVAKLDKNGNSNTDAIIVQLGAGNAPAAEECRKYSYTINGITVNGYLGACGEWQTAYDNKSAVNEMMSKIGGTAITENWYWTSTQYSGNRAWRLYWYDGSVGYDPKNVTYYVRPFYAIA